MPARRESPTIETGGGATGAQRSIKTLGTVVAIVFAGILIIEAGSLATFWSLMRFYGAAIKDIATLDETRESVLLERIATFAKFEFGALFVGAAAFLPWFYLAIANVRRSRFARSIDTPGWAIGGFLVPVLSLWKPATLMTDLATLSGRLAADDGGARPVAPTVATVWLWWGCYVVSAACSRISDYKFLAPETLEDLVSATRFNVCSNALAIFAGAMLILLTARITSLQERVRHGADLSATFG